MLKVSDLSVRYGDAAAVTGASFDVEEQEIAAIVGTNGAGKSSLARAVGGLTPASGTVRLGERDLSGLNAEGRVKAGVVYVPEGRRVFPQLTVEDNLRAGGFTRRRSHDWRRRMSELYERVPRLKERAQVRAGLLSGGEQQLLAICRALMARPSVLLMDEPSLGLAPRAIDAVADLLVDLRTAERLAVVIFEQNAAFTSRLANRAWVLRLGEIQTVLSKEQVADPECIRDTLMDGTSVGKEPERP